MPSRGEKRFLLMSVPQPPGTCPMPQIRTLRSEEHTSELQSRSDLVCRLLLEKKKIQHFAQAQHAAQTPIIPRRVTKHHRVLHCLVALGALTQALAREAHLPNHSSPVPGLISH